MEVLGPRVHVVIENGTLKNLALRPMQSASTARSGRLPFASLAITDAAVDALVEGVHVLTREVDADVASERTGAVEISLRSGETDITRVHPFVGRGDAEDAVDDDVICRLDARLRVDGTNVLVRRLTAHGSVDFDPDPLTRPTCHLGDSDWRKAEVRLGGVHVDIGDPSHPHVAGRVLARIPIPLLHRFVDIDPATGTLTADFDVDYDDRSQTTCNRASVNAAPTNDASRERACFVLPSLKGHVSSDMPGLDNKVFSKHVELDVDVTPAAIRATNVVALWADGRVAIPEVSIQPFENGVPFSTGPISVDKLDLAGLLRDLSAHPDPQVSWVLERGHFDYLRGHLDPLFLEGPLAVSTHDFAVYDRSHRNPNRTLVMGIKAGDVHCTFVINNLALSSFAFPAVVLSNFVVATPHSRVLTTVSIASRTRSRWK